MVIHNQYFDRGCRLIVHSYCQCVVWCLLLSSGLAEAVYAANGGGSGPADDLSQIRILDPQR